MGLSFCVAPILADDEAGSVGVFPGYYDISNVIFANANQGAYYFAFDEDGGGINAIHMASTDQAAPNYGDVTTTTSPSGTFYITDTGGRGYQDEAILMVAAKAPIPSNFSIHITSSGYTWTPTGNANDQPILANVTYHTGIDSTFTPGQFVYGPQNWRPAGKNQPENYPLYNGDDTTDTIDTYYLMFVDLKSGPLGPHGSNIDENTINTLNNHGAVRVDYTLSNLNAVVAFDAYCWNSNTNGGPLTDRGISWSNGLNSQASVPSMISGYTVLGPAYASDQGEFPTLAGQSPQYKSPDASFTSNATSGTAPLTVQFTDTTLQSVKTWSWDFGDGSNSSAQNPTHTYTTAGTYTVTMTVTNPQGMSGSATQVITVTSSSGGSSSGGSGGGSESGGSSGGSGNSFVPAQVSFTSNVTTGVAPLAVQFTDTSTTRNISSWAWNFMGGNSTDSSEQNPTFVFTNVGNYTVNLTVTTSDGSVLNVSRQEYIQATLLPASMGGGWVSSDQYTPPATTVTYPLSAIPSGGSATVNISQEVTSTDPAGINSISITAARSIADTTLNVSEGDGGVDTSQISSRPIAGVVQIEPVGVDPSSVSSGTITFAVSDSWVTSHQISTSDIVLDRYHEGNWVDLPTAYSYQTGGLDFFTATTPGFSFFAVTAKSSTAMVSSDTGTNGGTQAVKSPGNASPAAVSSTGRFSPLGVKVAETLLDCLIVVGVVGAGVIVWKKL